MDEGDDQERGAKRREECPLHSASSTSCGSHPGCSLDERHECHKPAEVPHERQDSSVGLWTAAAAVLMLVLVPAVAWAADAGSGQRLSIALAVLLGAIQGATEFLPVSSSGHLSVGQAWLGIDPDSAGHRFNIVLHAGTLVAVAYVYRSDIGALLGALLRPSEPSDDRRRIGMILLASTPLGLALIPAVETFVVTMETQVRWVGVAFIVTALVLFLSFRNQASSPPQDKEHPGLDPAPPSAKQAIAIGLAQVLAILPGISRSGSTIAAGIGVGLDRGRAARFSFLISLVAVGGATAKETLDVLTTPARADIDVLAFAAGFFSSLIVGLLSLRGLLYLVSKGKIGGFVVYLLLLGTVAIVVG